jgi:predicted transcriptional regulator
MKLSRSGKTWITTWFPKTCVICGHGTQRPALLPLRIGTALALMRNMNHRCDDRHRQTFMIRLPEIFRTKLRWLAEKTGKPMTALIKAALISFFAKLRLWRKEDERQLAKEEEGTPPKEA